MDKKKIILYSHEKVEIGQLFMIMMPIRYHIFKNPSLKTNISKHMIKISTLINKTTTTITTKLNIFISTMRYKNQ